MFRAASSQSVQQGPRFIAVGLVLCILALQSAARGDSPLTEIDSAESANNDLSRTIDKRLANEESTLEKLIELENQGHATWLEVCHRQLAVASLDSERKAASQFASFINALRRRLSLAQDRDEDFSSHGDLPVADLSAITLQIAATLAQARGDLQAAQLTLKRHELRVVAIEKLSAATATCVANSEELLAARRDRQNAQSLVIRLSSQHDLDVQSFHEFLQSSTAFDFNDCTVALADKELHSNEIPPRLLTRGDFVRCLLMLRNSFNLTAARREIISAQVSLTNELLRRTQAAQQQLNRTNTEIDRIQLDLKILQAEQLAAEEQITLLRLEELRFVAASASQPNDTALPVLRIDSPTSALPVFAKGLETRLSAGQQSPLTAVAWQPVAPNWPINNWSATRQNVAPSLPLSGNANIRYSEPNYADFYANGNRRLDAPSISNNFFRSGGLPWYLPGSTINFK
jgi:hypothetical protein